MEILTNPLVIGLLASIVTWIVYWAHQKTKQKPFDSKDAFKLTTYGFCVASGAVFLYESVAGTRLQIDQDIMTGHPDF